MYLRSVKRIGLTGGIGSGKSYIAKVLERMGYPVYYSDLRARELTESHPDIKAGLINRFGTKIYHDGELNRKELAKNIFQSEDDRNYVNELIHPIVRADFLHWCAIQKSELVFNEAAILFETGAYLQFDATVLVIAPQEVRIQRIMARDQCTVEQAESRIQSQWSDEQKIPLATCIITNDDKIPLLNQIERVIAGLSTAKEVR